MRSSAIALGASVLVLSIAGDAYAAGAPADQQPSGAERSSNQAAMSGLWSAGPVERWTGYRRDGASKRVRAVQRRLRSLGHRPGPVDGLFGPRTERAVDRFQRQQGLAVDGIVGPRTLARLIRQAGRRGAGTSGRGSLELAPRRDGRSSSGLESQRPTTRDDRASRRAPVAAPRPQRQNGPSNATLALLALGAGLVTLLALWVGMRSRGRPVRRQRLAAEPGSTNGRDWPPGPVWVVLPTYNEADNVERMLAALLRTFDDHRLPGHVLVVDDGSPDGTADLAEAIGAGDTRVEVLRRVTKDGIGPAYRAGFRRALAAGAALVMEMDCDFSHDPARVPELVASARDADVVLGARYVPGGGVARWNVVRRAVSRCGCEYARRLLGVEVRDLTGGFKCFRRAVLERIPLDDVTAAGYGFQIEMTYRAMLLGFRVVEVPITFSERELGSSKMSRRIVLEAALLVPRLRHRFGAVPRVAPVARPVVTPDLIGALARARAPLADERLGSVAAAPAGPNGAGAAPGQGALQQQGPPAPVHERKLLAGAVAVLLLVTVGGLSVLAGLTAQAGARAVLASDATKLAVELERSAPRPSAPPKGRLP